jgi:hypothetical protein
MANDPRQPRDSDLERRTFLGSAATAATFATTLGKRSPASPTQQSQTGDPTNDTAASAQYRFDYPDSLSHPTDWETLNPGYWKIENRQLRRRLRNIGDRARRTGFPFHSETAGRVMETEYDPSLPEGVLYRRDWKPAGDFVVSAEFTFVAARSAPAADDDPSWKMVSAGYGWFGLAFGAKSLLESFDKIRHAYQAVWTDSGYLEIVAPNRGKARDRVVARSTTRLDMQSGERGRLTLVAKSTGQLSTVTAELTVGNETLSVSTEMKPNDTYGYVGLTSRGLIDFSVGEFSVSGSVSDRFDCSPIACFGCYPLGDTLRLNADGKWQVRFVGMFASDGEQIDIRVSESERPSGGWAVVDVAGTAPIVNNDFRRNTATIDVTLPTNPSQSTMYYTVWKDGQDVTADSRIGTASTGPGTAMVGDVPSQGSYVGRLPKLSAPYRLCGLSCHAISRGLQRPLEKGYQMSGGSADWQFRDQPTLGAFQHLEEYEFQVMVWEDDVWYMELELYPPSTDDAYRVVTNSICGPTSRWQMMRHWNVINPGDHDYGMDDIKGPEQLAIRRIRGLGQDTDYLRRNFQIVHHLTTGEEEFDATTNPKKWRAWKMPNRDFTWIVLDSRLWRSSQDVDIWDDAGWGAFKSIYDRTDPTRSLLGEEQFGWLQEQLATDSSPLIGITGINGMHTVWAGAKNVNGSSESPNRFNQRDRVTADYAGWVAAGADRVLELLGSRTGVVTVYGDVHNGCIMTNRQHNVIECSFGPIGRSGGRQVIPGFGPEMKDVDGREIAISSLYHAKYADPLLNPHANDEPYYWNFLEMAFDPTPEDPEIELRIRNLVDAPAATPRGGGSLETVASKTARPAQAFVNGQSTFPNADVRFTDLDGHPLTGTRSRPDGRIARVALPDIAVGDSILMLAFDGKQTESKLVITTA